jgi:hydrogenase maturation protease
VPRLLILGYGNTLRGDDAFGFHAAEQLAASITDPEIEVLALHQLSPELMDRVSRAAHVIFLDARAEGAPGVLVREPVLPGTQVAPEAFTHHMTPAALLAGTQALYGHTPEAILYSTAGTTFEFGAPLSATAQAAIAQAVQEILKTESVRSCLPQTRDR